MSVNKVILIGRLGKDPEIRYTTSGLAVGNFSVATSEKWTDGDGNKQEKTEWHKVTVWKKQAENCAAYLQKGSQVYIEGKLQTREYEKDGSKRYSTEIVAQSVTFLDSKEKSESAQKPAQKKPAKKENFDYGPQAADDDDVPF